MSVTKLPSGRWRAQVYDPLTKANVSVSTLIGGPGTYRTKREAKAAREQARVHLGAARRDVTVAQFRERWMNDPLFARPRASTMVTNAARTEGFVARYGELPLAQSTTGSWPSGWPAVGTRTRRRRHVRCGTTR